MKITKNNILDFHVDYIEIYGTFKNVYNIIRGLDFDNSNVSGFEDFIIMHSDAQNYKYKLTFLKDNIPCFAYYEGTQINEYITTKNYFIVYGKATQILKYKEIFEFIETHLDVDRLRRFDLALDVIEEINVIMKHIPHPPQKGSHIFDEKGEVQTCYIGEKKNRLNASLLIRVYDKIADIRAKKMQYLYPDYLLHKAVTRLELEFRSELCKNVPLNSLKDGDYLLQLFITYIEKHTKIFSGLKGEKINKLVRPRKKIEMNNLTEQQALSPKYIKIFLGYAYKIKLSRHCPVRILIKNNQFNLRTLEVIRHSFIDERFSHMRFMNLSLGRNVDCEDELSYDENESN